MELRQWNSVEMLREHHNELLREAGLITQRRLAFDEANPNRPPLADRTLARFGQILVSWGHQLEQRHTPSPQAGRPATSDC